MNKRGQFFLVAAVIIVVIILGFISVSNYAKKEKYLKIYDMKDELEIESQKVLDYGIMHTDKMSDFGKDYSSYIGGETDIYFITGDSQTLEMNKYNNGVESAMTKPEIDKETILTTIDGTQYSFPLTSDNFYFILSQESGGEVYVVTG